MRKFLITSKKFTGEVEVIYNTAGLLVRIDLSKCELSADVTHAVKCKIPALAEGLKEFSASTSAMVIEAEFEASFEDFWREYPYKRNKHLAEQYWPKMTKTEQVQAWLAAQEYRKYCERQKEWYTAKIADTWLKKKEFLNNWKTL